MTTHDTVSAAPPYPEGAEKSFFWCTGDAVVQLPLAIVESGRPMLFYFVKADATS